MKTIIVGETRTQIKATIFEFTDDVIIIIGNEEGAHLGVTGLLEPYKNQKNETDVSISMISSKGHRDYDLIPLFKNLAKNLNRKIGIIGGIHIPNATKKEIEQIMNNVQLLASKLKKKYEKKKN